MTALATASDVLAWAARPAGSPPLGDVDDPEALATPGPGVCKCLQDLAVRTAARLGAGRPPFGDDGPVGLGAVLLAAAVGGRQDARAARRIARAAPPLGLSARDATNPGPAARCTPGWADAIARHGVVAPFADLAADGGSALLPDANLVEILLETSPLTAIVLRPPLERLRSADADVPLEAAVHLLSRPRGREVLISVLASPTLDADILTWRTRILIRLASANLEIVLDVYLAARIRYGVDWDDLLDWAVGAPGQSDARLALLQFWVPLAALDREDRSLLRSHPFLEGCRRAIDLAGPYV